MIQPYTRVVVADNSGAKELMCIRVIGESKNDLARLGDVIGFNQNRHTTRRSEEKRSG